MEGGDDPLLSENPFFALAKENFETDSQDEEGFVELEKISGNETVGEKGNIMERANTDIAAKKAQEASISTKTSAILSALVLRPRQNNAAKSTTKGNRGRKGLEPANVNAI